MIKPGKQNHPQSQFICLVCALYNEAPAQSHRNLVNNNDNDSDSDGDSDNDKNY